MPYCITIMRMFPLRQNLEFYTHDIVDWLIDFYLTPSDQYFSNIQDEDKFNNMQKDRNEEKESSVIFLLLALLTMAKLFLHPSWPSPIRHTDQLCGLHPWEPSPVSSVFLLFNGLCSDW